MPPLQLLSALKLRRTGGPSLLSPERLFLLEATPTAAALDRPAERWDDLLALARRRSGPWSDALPAALWHQARGCAARGGADALCGLLAVLLAIVVRRIGFAPAEGFRLARLGADGGVLLIVSQPPVDLGEDLLVAARTLLEALVEADLAEGEEATTRAEAQIESVWRLCDYLAPDRFLGLLIDAARARDLPVERLPVSDRRFLRLGQGRRQKRFLGALPWGQRSVAMTLGNRRDIAMARLRDAGIPIAPLSLVRPEIPAARLVEALGDGPVLLRRAARRRREEPYEALTAVAVAARLAEGTDGPTLVQRLPKGQLLRLFVFRGACVEACVLPRPDEAAGEARAFAGTLAPEILRLAAECALLLDLAFMSLDIVAPEPAAGPLPAEAVVLDVDPRPDPLAVMSARQGARLAAAFVAQAFPPGEDGRVPTVTILGPAADGLIAGLADGFRRTGRTPGLIRGAAVEIEGRSLPGPALPGERLLGDRCLEVALAAIEPRGVRQIGLPFERTSVAMIAPPSGDAPGAEAVARLLASTTRDALLLPLAGDPTALGAPSGLRLIAYGAGEAEAPWASEVVRLLPAGRSDALFIDRPGQGRPRERLAVLPEQAEGAAALALAALLIALELPLDRLAERLAVHCPRAAA